MLESLLERARSDDNVIGVVHSGSRGRDSYVTNASDWDAFVVVREERGDYGTEHGSSLEVSEVTLAVLAAPPDWARPAFLGLTPQLDKTGEIAKALRQVTTVDPATAGEPLDAYVNSYYRSAKNARVGLALASLLDAQESISWYLRFVFAVHGRLRPYNKWLEWELERYPLSVAVDLAQLERIARTADLADQQALFRETEELAREHGHGATIDGWEPDVARLTYSEPCLASRSFRRIARIRSAFARCSASLRQNSAVSFVFFLFAMFSQEFEDPVELHMRVLTGRQDSLEHLSIRKLSHISRLRHGGGERKMAVADLPRRARFRWHDGRRCSSSTITSSPAAFARSRPATSASSHSISSRGTDGSARS